MTTRDGQERAHPFSGNRMPHPTRRANRHHSRSRESARSSMSQGLHGHAAYRLYGSRTRENAVPHVCVRHRLPESRARSVSGLLPKSPHIRRGSPLRLPASPLIEASPIPWPPRPATRDGSRPCACPASSGFPAHPSTKGIRSKPSATDRAACPAPC